MRLAIYILCLAVALGAAARASIIIDPFVTGQDVFVSGSGNPKSASDSTAGNAPMAVGGQREFVVRRTQGTGRLDVDVDYTTPGALTFASYPNVVGQALITYDGPDTGVSGFPGVPDTFGLGGGAGIDLTEAGANNGFGINAAADNLGIPVIFTFYSSATRYARGTIHVSGSTTFDPEWYSLRFTDLTGTGLAAGETVLDILQHTKAITLELDGTAGSDAMLDNFTVVNLPEPATWYGAAAGGALLLFLRRRRT